MRLSAVPLKGPQTTRSPCDSGTAVSRQVVAWRIGEGRPALTCTKRSPHLVQGHAKKSSDRQVIGLLCSGQWRSGAWLAQLLSYKPGNLANRHLGPMVKEGTLERRFPDKPNHPEQAYRSIPTPPPAIRANLEQEAQP